MKKTNAKIEDNISVLVVTSSFPTQQNPVSGIFIKRLVDNLPAPIKVSVLTPCASEPDALLTGVNYQVKCFRYGPWKWQKLAHQPGGIPAALEQTFLMKLLLPVFLMSMFIRCVWEIPKVDIVHANWSVNGFICALANLFARRPLIVTLRGTDISKSNSSKVYKLLLRFAMRFSQVITVVSNAMRQRLVSQYPGEGDKISFVPNGVEDHLLEIPLKESRTTQEYFRVLVVANLIKLKNVPVIIKAISNLNLDDQLKIKLTIVGDGPEKSSLQKLQQELGVENSVEFAGLVNPNDMAEYFKHTDALVLTSLSEGKPNVVLEAFASGVPVIASNIDGVREMIGNNKNGLLFDPENDEMLTERLLELYRDDDLYKRCSINGRNYILQNQLVWGDTGKHYATIYKDLLKAS
ncbi:glycosyltransferase family 4 protein [Kaarinaea lacus]